jgi:tetraacyldisaccharide 4'-kinase
VAEVLVAAGERPALVSRGYGSRPGNPNDEAQELSIWLPGIAHVQNPDRVAAARQAIDDHGATCIVLDDGFQHRRLRRDLDVVLIDATCPFGHDRLLPRGLLREPAAALARADLVILTRVDQAGADATREIRDRISTFVPSERVAEVVFAPDHLFLAGGERSELEAIRGARVVGFCGIGNPEAFRRTLDDLEADVAEFLVWPDHHHYTVADMRRLEKALVGSTAVMLMCTMKDLVKVQRLPLPAVPLRAVVIAPRFICGEEVVRRCLDDTLASTRKIGPAKSAPRRAV